MSTFTTIELDRLLEPRTQNSFSRASTPKHEMQQSSLEKKSRQKYVSPTLYTTPEATPLPDSPISFPPSPYIVDHKRRGPRLLKGSSLKNVVECQQVEEKEKLDEEGVKGDGNFTNSVGDVSLTVMASTSCEEARINGLNSRKPEDHVLGDGLDVIDDTVKSVPAELERDCEVEDFFDPQDAMSVASNTEVDDSTVTEHSWKPPNSPFGEYFDASEELSIEGTPHSSRHNVEFELRGIRTNLLMEIERRKQAEEVLYNMQNQWQRLAQQLSLLGLSLPAAPVAEKDEQTDVNPAEELCQQVILSRVVANSVARGAARAEVELEMESHIEAKNFEITRLWDRLNYYEAVNREMSQRNQETVERARQQRHRRKRKKRWIWSSIGLSIVLGSAALAWSYLPSARESFSTSSSQAVHEGDVAATQEQTM